MMADYEDQLSQLREEDKRHKLLAEALNPRVVLHRIDLQQLSVINEEAPDWSLSTVQQDPEPPYTDEEQEELWIGQEEKQVNRLHEAGIIRFPFTAATMMSEDDEDKPQSSKLHQSQIKDSREAEPQTGTSTMLKETETDGGDCGECKPARDLHPDRHPRPDTVKKTEFTQDNWQEPLSACAPETENSDTGREKQFFPCKLKEHMRIHTGDKPLGCDVCGKRFSANHYLKIHMRIHTGERPFGCDVCGKRFGEKPVLQKHMRIHTGEKPFGCDVCGKRFSLNQHLITHMRTHTGEKPFGCDLCGKRFRQNHYLKIHTRVHTGERPFGCGVCGKQFGQKPALEKHLRVHTGERPFGCDVCGKLFTRNQHLTKHLRVHTGERPFPCDTCGKLFIQHHHLTNHLRVHTGEKPFPCDVCGKLFSQSQNLKIHLRVHTGERP